MLLLIGRTQQHGRGISREVYSEVYRGEVLGVLAVYLPVTIRCDGGRNIYNDDFLLWSQNLPACAFKN